MRRETTSALKSPFDSHKASRKAAKVQKDNLQA